MFQFIQRNSSINVMLIPIIILLLWGSNLLHPQFITHYYDTNPMILYKPLLVIQQWNGFVGTSICILFLVANILLLMRINSTYRLIEKRSFFYILLFIAFAASLPDFRQLNPLQPAMFFIILGIRSLFKLYKNERELKAVFEAGVCFSLASLFYAQAIFFALLVFIGLVMFVSFYWRQWVSAIIGIISPILVFAALAFCFDSLDGQFALIKMNFATAHKDVQMNLFPVIFSFVLAGIFVISAFYIFTGGVKKVSIRKYYLLYGFLIAIVLIVAFIFPFVGYEMFFFGLLPASLYIANFMENSRSHFIVEVFFIIIVVFSVLVQVFPNIPLKW